MAATESSTAPLVRRASPPDAARLHELAADTFELACPPGTAPEAITTFIDENLSVDRFVAYLADPAVTILVAGDFLGYLLMSGKAPTDDQVVVALADPQAFEISKLYVRAPGHGAGVGPALMAVAETIAREQGAGAMWLSVSEENGRANVFYERAGFRPVGSWLFEVGDERHHDLIYEKTLHR